jgi:hypothetical protein
MGTQRGQMKAAFSYGSSWACCAGTRVFCSPLAALVGPVENYIFLAVHCFNSFVPIAQQAGQAVVHAGSPVSSCVSLVATLAFGSQTL